MMMDITVDELSGYVSVLQPTQMGENIRTKLLHFSINGNELCDWLPLISIRKSSVEAYGSQLVCVCVCSRMCVRVLCVCYKIVFTDEIFTPINITLIISIVI